MTTEPIGPHLNATIAAWTAANDCAAKLTEDQATEPNLRTTLTSLAERWEQEAATAEAAIGHFEGPAAATLNAGIGERARIYRQTAADLLEVLRAGRVPHDLRTRAERDQAAAADPPAV